jgi:serine/threonine protein phosphatase PrpC
METVSVLRAAGGTDAGLQRDVNEDRFHLDLPRRLFMVIDGVGGQAAGGKAADTAVSMLRSRLERETGPVVARIREAIAVANNEIHRVAGLRPEWNGMACVLTVVVVDETRAIVGHVGDTRLYKVRHDRIEKVTRDHSPVGEREDAHELSEIDAMHHPRRNEVYRDVGSEPHGADDPDFVDLREISFEADAALLLCSDGLTDLIDSASIHSIVKRLAGQPHQVVKALIGAANEAGGKDNVTVVYIEGDQFAAGIASSRATEITHRLSSAPPEPRGGPTAQGAPLEARQRRGAKRERVVRFALLGLLAVLIVLVLARSHPAVSLPYAPEQPSAVLATRRIAVQPGQSIAQALQIAGPATTIVVEPGEYRETLTLKSHVRLVSRVRHGATIRLPGAASDLDAAIVARDVDNAALDGFRVIGDAATPLGTGVAVINSELSMSAIEITGAAGAAIDIDTTSRVSVIGSDIRDNPGAALVIRGGANATIAHNVFMRNGSAGGPQKALFVEENTPAAFIANVFYGISPDVFGGSSDTHATLVRDNWFVDARTLRIARPRPGGH